MYIGQTLTQKRYSFFLFPYNSRAFILFSRRKAQKRRENFSNSRLFLPPVCHSYRSPLSWLTRTLKHIHICVYIRLWCYIPVDRSLARSKPRCCGVEEPRKLPRSRSCARCADLSRRDAPPGPRLVTFLSLPSFFFFVTFRVVLVSV